MNNLKEIENEIVGCKKCPFDHKKDVRYCGGTGADHRVMFIAESPSTLGGKGIKSAVENFNDTAATDLFFEVRSKFGFGECYLTDVVKCGKAKGKPTNENIDNCLKYLKEEVRLVNPKVIIAVGKTFYIQVAPNKRKPVEFDRFIREKLQTQIPVISTHHYSYIWRYKKIKDSDKSAAKLEQIKPEWKQIYENQHREIQELLQR
ncbi:MAG: hypothetical protein M0Q51_01300 [Bacteroidales bacterium]|nr:hypothetical protein [Bacteroidales bacterium]